MRVTAAGLMVLAGAVTPAAGSGYAVYEQGARASAQAGAYVARADDPSALFYNPAGITQLDGWHVAIGTSAVFLGDTTFRNEAGGPPDEMERSTLFPSHLYLTHKASDTLSWGVGITTPYGLQTEWGEDTSVRFSARHAELVTAYLTPTLAVRIGSLSFAVGISYVRGEVRNFSRNLGTNLVPGPPPFPTSSEGETNLTGKDHDYTVAIGVLWKGESGYQAGLAFRGQAELEMAGEAEFDVDPSVDPLFPDGPGSALLPLPASAALGFAYTGGERWEIELDLVWTRWSTFDELPLGFENQTAFVMDETIAENWSDTLSYRVGFAYGTRRHEARAGLYYDETPIPDDTLRPSLPGADRWSAQAGYGFNTRRDRFALDLYLQRVVARERRAADVPADPSVIPGTYDTGINLLGLTLGWKI